MAMKSDTAWPTRTRIVSNSRDRKFCRHKILLVNRIDFRCIWTLFDDLSQTISQTNFPQILNYNLICVPSKKLLNYCLGLAQHSSIFAFASDHQTKKPRILTSSFRRNCRKCVANTGFLRLCATVCETLTNLYMMFISLPSICA
jgi:hypothetical protein